MKIGLIQTGGIGDIIIALPIAKYFVDRGHEVLWPIAESFLPSFVPAAPYVEFIPIKQDDRHLLDAPLERLKERGCERAIPLYSYVRNRNEVVNQGLAKSLKFDEYQYAVAGVPFREKWNLSITRDRTREERLFQEVVRSTDFIVAQLRSSDGFIDIDLSRFAQGREIVEITPRTDSIFDWLTVIERASMRVLIDSCFSNLAEQLEIPGRKIFIPRSIVQFTPVLRGDWKFLL